MSPLLDDDDGSEAIWKKSIPHGSGCIPDQFKSYDDLKKRMDYVLGTKKRRAPQEETEYDNYSEVESKKVSEEEVLKKLEDSYQASKTTEPSSSVDDDDDPCPTSAKLSE